MTTDSSPNQDPKNNWQLPDGIENAIESGIIKATVGAATGALLGSLMFKAGKGWRSAGIAMGVGIAVGSQLQRAYYSKSTVK